METKTCQECLFWVQKYESLLDVEIWATCTRLTECNHNDEMIIPFCEGGVHVKSKVDQLNFLTRNDFGCILFIPK